MRYEDLLPLTPGATIREQMQSIEMNEQELAEKLDAEVEFVNKLLEGHVDIDEELALELEKIFGISASFWLNLEASYREQLARTRRMRRAGFNNWI